MSGIQSSNITLLSSKLGFGEEFPQPDRDPKAFTSSIAKFRQEFSDGGVYLSPFAANSEGAQLFAERFCAEDNRGETLWPPNNHGAWPVWGKDRAKILDSLAHIFALQAYYQYQRQSKNKKQEGINTRAMSPSMMPVAPMYSPHAGARRDEQDEEIKACIQEIQSLERTPSTRSSVEFTSSWLEKTGARWPSSADPRLKTYMHEYNFYVSDTSDEAALPLVTYMSKGTEIEGCEGKLRKQFVSRLMDRVLLLTRELREKAIVVQGVDGKTRKTPVFVKVYKEWSNGNGSPFLPQWNSKDQPTYPRQTPYSLNTVHVDTPSKGKRKISDSALDESTTRNKRQSENRAANSETQQSTPSPFADDHPLMGSVAGQHPRERERRGHVETTKGVIAASSNNGSRTPIREPVGTAPVEVPAPSTPNPSGSSAPPAQPDTTSRGGPASRAQRPSQTLILIIQKSDLSLDSRNPLPSTTLRDLDVGEFFQLYSQKSGEDLDSLTHLTFTFLFAPSNVTIVKKGDHEAWKGLRKETVRLFSISSKRNPTVQEFEVLVEIRDMKSLMIDEDNLWGV